MSGGEYLKKESKKHKHLRGRQARGARRDGGASGAMEIKEQAALLLKGHKPGTTAPLLLQGPEEA